MKNRLFLPVFYAIVTAILVYFCRRTADVFSYAGYLFDSTKPIKYLWISAIVAIYYLVVIRHMTFGSHLGLRSLFVHLLFVFIVIPMMVYSVFSSFTTQVLIGYNVAIITLVVAMYTGPIVVPKTRISSVRFIRFLYRVFFVVSVYFIVVGIRSGVLSYIVGSGFKYDVYVVRRMYYGAFYFGLEGYVFGNYLIFLGPFMSVLSYTTAEASKKRFLPSIMYLVNVVFSGNKAPILYMVIAFFVANVNLSKLLSRRNILYLISFCCGVIVFISVLSYLYDVPFGIYVVSMLGRRTFFTPARIAEAYFLEFPKDSPFLGFAGLLDKKVVLGGAAAGTQGALRYYISQKYFGTFGAANTNFIAEAYANFGYIAIFVYSLLLGKMLRVMDFASRKMDDSVRRAFLASSLLPLLQLSNIAFTTTLLTFGLMLSFVCSILLVDTVDNKKGYS